MKKIKFNFDEISPNRTWFHFTERVWIIWYLKVIFSCCCSFTVGCTLVNYFRERCKKTNDPWNLARILFSIPLCIYLLLSWAAQKYLYDRVIADAFSFGVVLGILYKLNSTPVGKSTIKLIAHHLDGRYESVWLDSMDATVGEAREKLAAMLPGMETKICLESGKGSLLEDMDAALLPLLHESVTRDFFGFTTVQCHFSTRELDSTSDAPSDSTRRQSGGGGGVMKLFGMSNKVVFGQNLMLNAKVFSKNSDSRDVRALVIAPVDFNHTKFAAAAPSRGSMLDKIDGGGNITVRLLSWHSVKVGDVEVFSENEGPAPSEGSSNSPSAKSSAKSGQSSPIIYKRKEILQRSPISGSNNTPSSMVSQVATKLLNRNLESSLPIRNGEMVVVESDGKFMSVAKGWWMAWFSTSPRRSGAFKIEILERGEGLEQQLGKGLKNIKDKMNSSMLNISSKSINNNEKHTVAPEAPIEADAVLRAGDSFRLRSMKFPEYELGVTSDKIKDDYCYLGLRKVAEESDGSEWCMPVRFSVKTTSVFKG